VPRFYCDQRIQDYPALAADLFCPALNLVWKEEIMNRVQSSVVRPMSRWLALALVAYIGIAAAHAKAPAKEPAGTIGRIDFGEANLPPAKVEIDVSEGMFTDLFGLGEAAIAGVVEQLQQAAGKNPGAESTQLASEQLAAAQQIIKLARGVVHEVRVRVYEGVSEEKGQVSQLMDMFQRQLQAGRWENVVRVRDKDDVVQVSLLRDGKGVCGAFIIMSEGNDLILANVVGNVSPENVKKLTAAATKIGLENGLQQELDVWARKLQRRTPATSTPAAAPAATESSDKNEN
jgi:hypothetical protein